MSVHICTRLPLFLSVSLSHSPSLAMLKHDSDLRHLEQSTENTYFKKAPQVILMQHSHESLFCK